MVVFWKVIKRVVCRIRNIGYIDWIYTSIYNECKYIASGSYFSFLLVKYYPNERPLGEFIIANEKKFMNQLEQDNKNRDIEDKQKFAMSIQQSIQRILTNHIKKSAKSGFNPKDFQEELGYTLSMRKDIHRVRVKKLTKLGQNGVRVAIDIFPEGWEKKSKMSFTFDFRV